jgi:hypothetical protein
MIISGNLWSTVATSDHELIQRIRECADLSDSRRRVYCCLQEPGMGRHAHAA